MVQPQGLGLQPGARSADADSVASAVAKLGLPKFFEPEEWYDVHGRVTTTEQLTPGMVRVVLGGGDLEHLAMPDATDAYVNVAFRPAAASYDEVFDPQAVRETHPQEE